MKDMMKGKKSFILYCNYEEQLNMLTDVQAGQLIRGIFAYMRTGEQHSSDPMVNMLLSVICHQLDVDNRKYEETRERRREAGRKGGLQRAENKANASNDSNTKQSLANLADNDNVNENVNVNDYIFSGDGDDVGAEEEEYAWAPVPVVPKLISYTDNGYPTTQEELDKCSAFTDKLFRSYWNRKPSKYDMAQVFDYVYGYAQLPDGTGYAVFDAEKAELLLHVFKLAANSDSTKWKYVDGVYKRFRERDIHTLYDAQRYDWELEHGKGVLV